MAYNYYRLKINGTVLNDSFIAMGTYTCENAKRLVRSWKDGNGITHEVYAPTAKASVKFSLREHDSDEHSAIMALFQSDNDYTIEYYDDRSDSYKTGTFALQTMNFSHRNISRVNGIQYNQTEVVFEER